jgi:hypothetical protein
MNDLLERADSIVDLDMLRRQFPDSPCVVDKLHDLGNIRKEVADVIFDLLGVGAENRVGYAVGVLEAAYKETDALVPFFPEDVVRVCHELVQKLRIALSQLNRSPHSEGLL